MRRTEQTPRPGWQGIVESQGLIYPITTLDDGRMLPYWFEGACYELTPREVDHLEAVTAELHRLSLEAARLLATGALGNLGLPPRALQLAAASLESDPPSLYGRFDLIWDGSGEPKLLEYNADTPTGLLEAAVTQWFWLEDVHPESDQWNSLHERLIRAWTTMRPRLADGPVHFSHHEAESSGEELMTVTYLRDTADMAGLPTVSIPIGGIGYDPARSRFVDLDDEPIHTCFKLYPWELMLGEEFGGYVRVDDPRPSPSAQSPQSPQQPADTRTVWLEPVWKVLLSNKALLAALWRLFPGHPNLLPAYLDSPGPLTSWVAKPLHGREGANIRIHAPGLELESPGEYGVEGYCYQQYQALPDFGGNHPVLGCWIIDGHPAGLGIRESDGPVTDHTARFVPHLISSSRPTLAQRNTWIDEDSPVGRLAP